MAIVRTKNKLAYGFHLDKGVSWAYASSGGTISTFVADDSNPENIVGATYRVHKFSSIGASSIFFDTAGLIDVFVVAGGGGGGNCGASNQGGGGGAGGMIVKYQQYIKPGLTNVFVGAGGPNTLNGQNSLFGQFLAIGGGSGATNADGRADGGGSGGGSTISYGGSIVGQGFPGGYGNNYGGVNGGGGGAGEAGNFVYSRSADPPNGGDGLQVAFENNTPTYYAGGGVGGVRGVYTSPLPTGGLGGGANLGGTPGTSYNGGNATFYGGGGGGAARTATSGSNIGGLGYQGLVMVRYVVGAS